MCVVLKKAACNGRNSRNEERADKLDGQFNFGMTPYYALFYDGLGFGNEQSKWNEYC